MGTVMYCTVLYFTALVAHSRIHNRAYVALRANCAAGEGTVWKHFTG